MKHIKLFESYGINEGFWAGKTHIRTIGKFRQNGPGVDGPHSDDYVALHDTPGGRSNRDTFLKPLQDAIKSSGYVLSEGHVELAIQLLSDVLGIPLEARWMRKNVGKKIGRFSY